jgi:hypothetical protein
MISLTGDLVVKIINGRNGPFRVGNLHTEIGEFAVKDKILDQYDEGSYRGLFDVSKIFSSSYTTGSRLVVEVRAVLVNIALANIEVIDPEQLESLEQDPLDEEKKTENVSIDKVDTPESIESSSFEDDSPKNSESEENKDAILFGLLWPLQESFKLDPTVNRELFRQQRDRLKSLGYQFKPIGQYWSKA